MIIVKFISLAALSFILMELLSYVLHRYIFHGLFWKIHKTHHESSHSVFELNDLFSFSFSIAAIVLMIIGLQENILESLSFPIGMGITIYGILYFIIHDIYTHKRFAKLKTDNRIINIIKKAHQKHHQSAKKIGNEPYGLFLFDYELFSRKVKK
jgi:beta-carotene 3-hydroxylase